jgi:two-component SAPR family response regulator
VEFSSSTAKLHRAVQEFRTALRRLATSKKAIASHDALEFARRGGTLIVWKLDRLARSMKQLIETIEDLRVRGIGFPASRSSGSPHW